MAIDLTSVYHKINTIKRNLFFDSEAGYSLKFMNLNDELLELTDGFYVSKNPNFKASAKMVSLPDGETIRCSIADLSDDGINLEEILPFTTTVVFSGEKFKIEQYTRPRGASKQWRLRLQSLGEYA